MKNYIIVTTIILCSVKLYAQRMIFTENITATKSHLGEFGSAVLQIDDAGNDGMITRPLIVAEGFESGLLGKENKFGENNIEKFIKDLERSTSVDLRNLLTNQTEFIYGDQDYDIIYVNWDSPRAHLQLNAFVLEEVINWVNQEKEDDADQNVVLGQSMGGVIARYALADMEDDPDLDHDTKLYISHDAPHQGANIPLGIQYFARHLADQFIETPLGDYSFEVSNDSEASLQEINALFDDPGTKQLLANYITPGFELDNDDFENFQTDLRSKGYPNQTRNIAISNGSHCANTQDFGYNASLIKIDGKARTGLLTDALAGILGIADGLALAITFNEPALVLGILPGGSAFNLDFNAKALPSAGSSANIYKGKISYTKRIFDLFNITVNLTDREYDNPVNLSYDKYAGGKYELFRDINDADFFDDDNDFDGDGEPDITQFQADMLNALLGSVNLNFDVEETFGFIPTPSALDVGGGTTNLVDNDFFKIYNATNPPSGNRSIPFHNFITAFENNSSLNEQHISFNFRNGDWLAKELDPSETIDIFDCSYICNDLIIIGDNQLCTSGTYSIDVSAPNVSWSKVDRNNLANLNSNYGNQITITQNDPNKTGFIRLTATYGNSDCGTKSSTMTVYLGKPDAYTIDSGGNKNYMGGGFYFPQAFGSTGSFSVFSDTPNTTFTWSGPSNLNWWNTNNNTVEFYLNQSGNYFFTATATNGCATHPYFVSVNIGGTGPDPIFRVAPNPVKTNTLIVQDVSSDSKSSKNFNKTANTLSEAVTFTLYDFNGHVVQTKTLQRGSAGKEYRLDVSGLKNRNYFVKITCGTIEETYQIILKK